MQNKMIFIPKDIYKTILHMKYEMEMIEEIHQHIIKLNNFYDYIIGTFHHYSFPFFSYHMFCFHTKEIGKYIPLLQEINHVSVYQKDKKSWYYIKSKKSGYHHKMKLMLEKNDSYPIEEKLKHFFILDNSLDLNRYELMRIK